MSWTRLAVEMCKHLCGLYAQSGPSILVAISCLKCAAVWARPPSQPWPAMRSALTLASCSKTSRASRINMRSKHSGTYRIPLEHTGRRWNASHWQTWVSDTQENEEICRDLHIVSGHCQQPLCSFQFMCVVLHEAQKSVRNPCSESWKILLCEYRRRFIWTQSLGQTALEYKEESSSKSTLAFFWNNWSLSKMFGLNELQEDQTTLMKQLTIWLEFGSPIAPGRSDSRRYKPGIRKAPPAQSLAAFCRDEHPKQSSNSLESLWKQWEFLPRLWDDKLDKICIVKGCWGEIEGEDSLLETPVRGGRGATLPVSSYAAAIAQSVMTTAARGRQTRMLQSGEWQGGQHIVAARVALIAALAEIVVELG